MGYGHRATDFVLVLRKAWFIEMSAMDKGHVLLVDSSLEQRTSIPINYSKDTFLVKAFQVMKRMLKMDNAGDRSSLSLMRWRGQSAVLSVAVFFRVFPRLAVNHPIPPS